MDGSIYRLIADHYDLLFPLGERQEAFLAGLLSEGEVGTALDVGAATGRHLAWLSARGVRGTGLEPDSDLFSRLAARPWPGPPPDLLDAGFERLPLPGRAFDLVLCLGNTLPHAADREAARRAVAGMVASTAPGGALALQTVNFDAVARRRGWQFPAIERGLPDGGILRLERSYDVTPLPEAVDFRITVSTGGSTRSAVTRLLALRSEEILGWLAGAGEVRLAGDYDGSPFTPESPAQVVTLRRPR